MASMGEIAKTKGISVRTLYRWAELQGINISDLRDEQGNLTPEGITLLGALTGATDDKRHNVSSDDTKNVGVSEAELLAKIEGLQRENAILRESLRREQTNADNWRTAYLTMLPSSQPTTAAPEAVQQGWFARIFRRK